MSKMTPDTTTVRARISASRRELNQPAVLSAEKRKSVRAPTLVPTQSNQARVLS
jgi:hypothetical protein